MIINKPLTPSSHAKFNWQEQFVCTDSFFQFLGLDRDTPSLVAFFRIVHSDDRRRLYNDLIARITSDDIIEPIQFRVLQPDGSFEKVFVLIDSVVHKGDKTLYVSRFFEANDFDAYIDSLGQVRKEVEPNDEELRTKDVHEDFNLTRKVADHAGIGWYEHYKLSDEIAYSDNLVDLLQMREGETFSIEWMKQNAIGSDCKRIDAKLDLATEANPCVNDYIRFRIGRSILWFDIKIEYIFKNGVPVKSFGLLQDITSLKIAEYNLAQIKKISGLGWHEIDFITDRISATDRFHEILGHTKDKIESMADLIRIVHPDDLPEMSARLVSTQCNVDHEVRVFSETGQLKYLRVLIEIERDQENHPVRAVGTVVDITQTKRLENRLKKTQELAKIGGYELDHVAECVVGSDMFWSIQGFSESDKKPHTFEELTSLMMFSDLNVKQEFERIFADPNAMEWQNLVFKLNSPSGDIIWARAYGEIERNEKGEPIRSYGVLQNITEQKNYERQISQLNQIKKLGWHEIDFTTGKVNGSDQFFEMLGVSSEEMAIDYLVSKMDQSSKQELVRLMRSDQTSIELQFKFYKPFAGVKSYKIFSEIIRDKDGSPLTAYGTLVDLTMEITKENRMSKIENLANVGWYEVDVINHQMHGSNTFYSIYGLEDDPWKDSSTYVDLVHPEDLHLLEPFQNLGDPSYNEWSDICFRIITPADQIKHVRTYGEIIRDESGQPVSILGVVMDITREEEIQKMMRYVQQKSGVAWLNIQLENPDKTTLSDSFLKMHGASDLTEVLDPQKFVSYLHPEDREEMMRLSEQVSNGERTHWDNMVYRVINKDGSLTHIQSQGEVTWTPSKSKVQAILIVVSDISDRADKELFLEQTQKVANIGWYEMDVIKYKDSRCSTAFLEIMGMTSLGRFPSLDELLSSVHPEDRHLMQETITNFKQIEDDYIYTVRVQTSEGTRQIINKAKKIRDLKTNGVIKILGTIQDITELKTLEDKLQLAQEISNTGWYEYNLREPKRSKYSERWLKMHDLESNPTLEDYLQKLHPKDRAIFGKSVKKFVKKQPESWDRLDFRIVTSAGDTRYISNSSRVIYEHDEPVKLFGVTTDVTDRIKAQKALFESEHLHRLLSETSRDVIILLEGSMGNTVISYVSDSVTALLGYSKEELIGTSTCQIVHPDDIDSYLMHNQEMAESDGTKYAIRFMRKDKSEVWVELIANSFKNKEKDFTRLSVRDITSRRQYEEDLIRANNELNALITARGNLVFAFDHNGRFERVIGKEVKLHIPSEEFLGHQVEDIWNDLNGIYMSKMVRESLKIRNSRVFDCQHDFGNGNLHWHRVSTHPYEDMDGRTKVCVIIEDITERYHFEQEILSANSELNALIKATGNLVFAFDAEGKFERVIGDPSKLHIPAAAFIDHSVEKIWNDPNGVEMAKMVRRSLGSGAEESFECIVDTKNGEQEWHLVTTHPYTGVDGHMKVCVVKEDVTAQKKSEHELKRTLKMERELSKMRSNFVAMASHQFRTPLTVIKSNMQLVKAHGIDDPVINRVSKRLVREVDRLVSLMEDILVLGKVQANQLKAKPAAFDLSDLIDDILNDIVQEQTDGRQLKVHDQGEPQGFYGDYHLIRHALINIIQNAFKYSQGCDDPELYLDYSPEDYIEIRVKDYGIGIPGEDQKGIFQDFYRGSNVKDIPGTGLGMSITREFLQINNCQLYLDSEENKGSIFTIHLPK